jgi:flagella basal body P-ring formation protein FlgA
MIRFLILVGLAVPAAAGATDLAALDRAVARFAGAPLGTEGGPITPIDSRLRLKDCSAQPLLGWRNDRHDAVVISCPDADGWRLFVPVKTAAGALAATPVKLDPVIRRGDPVTVSAEKNGFTVSSDGVAMGDAAPGARVAIKVEGAKNPVLAVAVAPGQASLPGF